jgi:hypothetical protein
MASSGEQPGVHGPGDRRVQAKLGHDGLGEHVFHVAAAQGTLRLGDEDGPVVVRGALRARRRDW